jgi:hypothetical protein
MNADEKYKRRFHARYRFRKGDYPYMDRLKAAFERRERKRWRRYQHQKRKQ